MEGDMNWADKNGCPECNDTCDGCSRCAADVDAMIERGLRKAMNAKTQELPHLTDDAVYEFMSTGRWPQVAP
jgi:hypothetical protein